MATYLSRKEAEEMKPQVDKAVEKFLGFSEPSLVTTAINCLSSGYNKKKTTDELAALLDPGMAAKLAERIFELSVKPREVQSKRRHHELPEVAVVTKRARPEPEEIPTLKSAMAVDAQLSANQIKSMMANAQKMIEERKRALNALRSKEIPPVRAMSMQAMPELPVKPLKTLPSLLSQPIPSLHRPADDKAKQIAQLQARIQSKLSTGVLSSMMIGKPASQDKPTPLILDSEGRTVDVTGKEIQLTHVVPTLKANIRAKKHEEFRQKLQERTVEDISESHFFDSRIAAKPNIRNKRALRFHEPGKFQQLADRMRMKAQLEKLQTEISQIAQKTGITSATKLALIAPKVETQTGEIPRIEWWDSVILERDVYGGEENGNIPLKEEAITNLVEHPTQIRPPTEPLKSVYMPVFLTQKERKKLRRQNRREAWKEEQEKIRLGLEPPPEPKLRISNLMRVLGTEAVQDPTKMEAHVRAQMAKRRKAHEEANAARRLTDEQRREKRVRRLQEDTTLGVKVAVYRVKELTSASKKFKVETNANQLYMTGSVVMYKDCNVVVVEGGAKQQNKFKRLMLHRIKWEEDMIKSLASGKDEPNKCVLVWEGMTQQRNFGEMKFKICTTEKLAREQFKKHGVEQYWDLAYSATVIETSEEK